MNPPRIDLNADLGEGCPNDEALLELVTSASVSCGAHAGDLETIRRTLREAARQGVHVGAHPGFPDRKSFGRLEQSIETAEVVELIRGQVADLEPIAREEGVTLDFLKPHGALYNQAQREPAVALGVAEAARQLGLPLLGQSGSRADEAARRLGVRFISEGFPDRRYEPDGRLVPRSRPDAILHDLAEVEAQVCELVRKGFQTLCIHGDDPNAIRNAKAVLAILERQSITARFWGE